MPLLATIFVRQHSSKKLAFPAGFATASLPLKAPLLTSATPIQPHSPAQSYFRYETITIQRWARHGKTLLSKHRLFQPLFLLLTKVQTVSENNNKQAGFLFTFYGAHSISHSTFKSNSSLKPRIRNAILKFPGRGRALKWQDQKTFVKGSSRKYTSLITDHLPRYLRK